jgi:peptide/nickel transport system substrate-binding protein
VAAATWLVGCSGSHGKAAAPSAASGSSSSIPAPAHPRGGSARVGVWGEPDPLAATLGGAAVRALVLPQLFVAGADGRWTPSLVQPGSDHLASDRRSARFRLRPSAEWSNGAPITAADLKRSADHRFVAGVDESTDGMITVRFTQPLPGWHRLWSGVDSVSAPADGVWGGPFVVATVTRGLETVLRRNARWWGAPAPYLDELRLVLVPDATTARQLLERGELDALMPPAGTARTRRLTAVKGISTDAVNQGGWWVGLFLPANRLSAPEREAVVGAVDRPRFLTALLQGEALPLNGLVGAEDATWASVMPSTTGWKAGAVVQVAGEDEEPMTPLVERVIQDRGSAATTEVDLRNADAARVEQWITDGTYDAGLAMTYDGPDVCWTCRWSSVDAALATAADSGDRRAAVALEAEVRNAWLALPLWRPRTVVAWRGNLHGLQANGFGLDAAWNAWEWWRT